MNQAVSAPVIVEIIAMLIPAVAERKDQVRGRSDLESNKRTGANCVKTVVAKGHNFRGLIEIEGVML